MDSIWHQMDSGDAHTTRDAELQTTVQRLEAFSSHVAHDLRDALSGIAGLAEIAYAKLDERQDRGTSLRSL